MTIEDIAKICHQANKAYCETLGDCTQRDWSKAPKWQRDTVINGVQFHIKYPNKGPRGSHNNWLKVKEEDGWKYGKVKSPKRKEHPCMLPYDELPEEQRIKDYMLFNIVQNLKRFL